MIFLNAPIPLESKPPVGNPAIKAVPSASNPIALKPSTRLRSLLVFDIRAELPSAAFVNSVAMTSRSAARASSYP